MGARSNSAAATRRFDERVTASNRSGVWIPVGGPSYTQLKHLQVQRSAPGGAIHRRSSGFRRPGSRGRSPVYRRSRADSNCQPVSSRRALSEREDLPAQVRQLSCCCQTSQRFADLVGERAAGLGQEKRQP